ncbi:hypothetical protein [Streptomyces sp. NPDC014006]|uniref:hypothetical protein n=1 Tax=Streptomyces sp. NPDC014006 TaxID=3364870 RepID=UPI003701ED86
MGEGSANVVQSRLANAGHPSPHRVSLPYEEVIRVVLLVGHYEKAWEEHQIGEALNWWRALPEALPESGTWTFTLRDLEPAWINETEDGDFTAVYVSTDEDGRMMYQVISSHGGEDSGALCPDVTSLNNTLSRLAQ